MSDETTPDWRAKWRCDTCVYWTPGDKSYEEMDGIGSCKRHAPRLGFDVGKSWPQMAAYDHCGDWCSEELLEVAEPGKFPTIALLKCPPKTVQEFLPPLKKRDS